MGNDINFIVWCNEAQMGYSSKITFFWASKSGSGSFQSPSYLISLFVFQSGIKDKELAGTRREARTKAQDWEMEILGMLWDTTHGGLSECQRNHHFKIWVWTPVLSSICWMTCKKIVIPDSPFLHLKMGNIGHLSESAIARI